MEGQAAGCEETFADHPPNKGLVSKYIKNSHDSAGKKQMVQLENELKRTYKWQRNVI